MIDKISMYFLRKTLYKDEYIEKEKEEVILFSIRRIIGDILKIIIIIIISILLNTLKEFFIVLAITLLYKSFVGGAHAKTDIECISFSIIYYVLPAILAKYIIIPNVYTYIIFGLVFIESLYIILKIAPADTEEVPILCDNTRKKMKIKALIALLFIYCISLVLVIIFQYNIYILNIISITLFTINLYTTKLAYRFFRCKYSYESEEIKNIIDSYKKEGGSKNE